MVIRNGCDLVRFIGFVPPFSQQMPAPPCVAATNGRPRRHAIRDSASNRRCRICGVDFRSGGIQCWSATPTYHGAAVCRKRRTMLRQLYACFQAISFPRCNSSAVICAG